ncbi:hypothetical protein HDU97_001749 [Phlyctochytrium planicorne]|nr:hypothetical protein HDU97_001749 [Phlyctochytrium planicorne]
MDLISQDSDASFDLDQILPLNPLNNSWQRSSESLSSAFPNPAISSTRGPYLNLNATVRTLLVALEELISQMFPESPNSPSSVKRAGATFAFSPPGIMVSGPGSPPQMISFSSTGRTGFEPVGLGLGMMDTSHAERMAKAFSEHASSSSLEGSNLDSGFFAGPAGSPSGSLRRKRSAAEASPELFLPPSLSASSSFSDSPYSSSYKARRLGTGLSTRFTKSLKVGDPSSPTPTFPLPHSLSTASASSTGSSSNANVPITIGLSNREFTDSISDDPSGQSGSAGASSSTSEMRRMAWPRNRPSNLPLPPLFPSNIMKKPSLSPSTSSIWMDVPPHQQDNCIETGSTLGTRSVSSSATPCSFRTTPSTDAMDEDGNFEAPSGRSTPSERVEEDESLLGTRDEAWSRKKRELEYNLSLLQNGSFCGDSYEDMRNLVEKIVGTAVWLSGGELGQLQTVVPIWGLYKENVEKVLQYISIVEDMKTLLSHKWDMQGDLDTDLTRISAFLEQKSPHYSEVMNYHDSVWKRLGFPIEEDLIRAVAQWLFSLPWRYWLLLEAELQNRERAELLNSGIVANGKRSIDTGFIEKTTKGPGLSECILNGLSVGADYASLIRRPLPPKMDDMAICMASVYLEWATMALNLLTTSSTNRPSPNAISRSVAGSNPPRAKTTLSGKPAPMAKVALLMENATRVLEYLRVLRTSRVTIMPALPAAPLAGRRLASPSRVGSIASSNGGSPANSSQENQRKRFSPMKDAMLASPLTGDFADGFGNRNGKDEAVERLGQAATEFGLSMFTYIGSKKRNSAAHNPVAVSHANPLVALACRYVRVLFSLTALDNQYEMRLMKLSQRFEAY